MAQLELASESGDLEAVQAALAQARCSLDDLDLAYQLQRQEFFGDGAEDSGAESLDSSQGHDSVEELKLALELQVEQLTERLQQLKDAELARKVHAESLSKATQEAFDHHLARLLADKEDDACDVESVAESLQETVLADEEQHPTAVLSVAAALNAQQHPGLAGCGALLTSPAGDTLWEGVACVRCAGALQAQLESLLLGLTAASQLCLPDGWRILVKTTADTAAEQVRGALEANSSVNGGLVDQVQQLLHRKFGHWDIEVVEGEELSRAELLAGQALMQEEAGSGGADVSSQEHSRGSCQPAEGCEAEACCSICFDMLPASQFHVIGGCLHRFCRDCLRGHAQAVIKSRTYPVICPEPGCSSPLSSAECELLLAASPADMAMYRQVEAEFTIPSDHRFYCPNPHCSAPIQLPARPQPNEPVNCPKCDSKICPYCRIAFHKGLSCEDYQGLPSTLRQPEDLALLNEAARRQWRQCGQCKHMIELREGCRHITCKCGYEFCYTCGVPWVKLPGEPSRQACKCNLFEVPPEPLEDEDAAARLQRAVQEATAALEREPPRYLPPPRDRRPVPDDIPRWVPDEQVPVYKTSLCQYYLEGKCRRRRCTFAHGGHQLRRYGHYGSRA